MSCVHDSLVYSAILDESSMTMAADLEEEIHHEEAADVEPTETLPAEHDTPSRATTTEMTPVRSTQPTRPAPPKGARPSATLTSPAATAGRRVVAPAAGRRVVAAKGDKATGAGASPAPMPPSGGRSRPPIPTAARR
jgi:hypothetical protein